MKNSTLVALVVVVLIVAGGLVFYNNRQKTTVPTTTTPTSAPMEDKESIEVTLNEVPGSPVPQSGTATLTEVDGRVKVSVSLTGTEIANPQPIHIHSGTCAAPGDVVYPLTDVVNGKSETTLEVTMDALLAQSPLLINAHKSASEQKVYTACGELPASSTEKSGDDSMMKEKEDDSMMKQDTGTMEKEKTPTQTGY